MEVEDISVVISIVIVLMLFINIFYWLASAETQDWLQYKYYKFRMWRIKRKNKKNEWKWGDEIEWQ